MPGKLKKIWNNRGLILEGVINSVIIKEEIENVAAHRESICKACESYDLIGKGCEVPGTQPCCSNLNGGCGCILHFKLRSMSSSCPKGYWNAELTQHEEDTLPDVTN